MAPQPNRQVLLHSRPAGIPQAQNFMIADGTTTEPTDGEVVVRNAFLSVEPAMRGWIADTNNYLPPVPIGSVMRAIGVGVVIQSRHPDYVAGDPVTGWFGWQEVATVSAQAIIRKVREPDLALSLTLGVTGLNGVTALLGLTKIGQPKAGDTIVVSTAAGAVGSAVGQIAKILGCRTVGIAGGPTKVAECLDLYNYDAAFDYRSDDLNAAMAKACPDGVDVYFDNTSGPISDVVHRHLAMRARIVVCGTASISTWTTWPEGPRVERHMLVKRARMEGFVLFDHIADYEPAVEQLAAWVTNGRLAYREDILDGIETCPDAIAGLYRGENHGKRVIRLRPE